MNFYEKLGSIVVAFQDLEHAIEMLIFSSITSELRQIEIIMSLISFKSKVNIMNALLLELHSADDKLLDSTNIHYILADIKKKCHTSEQRRNQLIHSKWIRDFKNAPDLMLRTKDSATSKKGYSYSVEDMNTSQLEEDIKFINKTAEHINKLRNDLSLKFIRTHGLDGLSNIFTHKSLTDFINDSFLKKHNPSRGIWEENIQKVISKNKNTEDEGVLEELLNDNDLEDWQW